MDNAHSKARAFTLVEILTTVTIIGILLAILIPALNQVGKTALNVKQKAQFHTIEMALEAFRSDRGDYPPSVWDGPLYDNYSASQRLAEAIIGMDGLGFHRDSVFNPYSGLYDPPIDLAVRKGPYLELESANAVLLSHIFGTSLPLLDSYVLADSFRTVRHQLTGKKTGMPILYYKANRLGIGNSEDPSNWASNTYNLSDSYGNPVSATSTAILSKPHPIFGVHPLSFRENASMFYQRIQNPNFISPLRPYRAESFILHSAGPDGRFGTADDVFNFDEGN